MTGYIEQFWRDATVADVAMVMESETVEARFADDGSNWVSSKLRGWRSSRFALDNWIDDDGARWDRCQVYDPPQWYLDKPDPEEGHRLLGKFPDEPKHRLDEIFRPGQGWFPIGFDDGVQDEDYWYRRKIEQPKPEPKFAVGQRVKIVGPKARPFEHWDGLMDKYINETAEVISVSSTVGEKVFYHLRFIELWAFREDYLEAVVEPEPKHYVLQVGDTADTPRLHIKVTEHGIEVQ